MDLALITYNGWCAIKLNQTKPTDSVIKAVLTSTYEHDPRLGAIK